MQRLLVSLLLMAGFTFAQTNVVRMGKVETVKVKAGSSFEVKIPFELREGYHLNSNTPSDKYLIPLRLTWTTTSIASTDTIFPKPALEKYSFSPVPLSVFSGTFVITSKFKVAPTAPAGPTAINGKLRYQACNDRECLAPQTLDVALQVNITK